MKRNFKEFLQSEIDPKYTKTSNLRFERIRLKLANLDITDQLGWITVYKSIDSTDLDKLTTYYAQRLTRHLSPYSVSELQKEFNLTWQYYQPLNHIKIQNLVLTQIYKTNNDRACTWMLEALPELLIGTTPSSKYAKELLNAVTIAIIQSFTIEDLTINSKISDLKESVYINSDDENGFNDGDQTEHQTIDMLEKGINIFNFLIKQMSQSDREYAQLLILILTDQKELIPKQKHLKQYEIATSLLTDNMSIQETMNILENLTKSILMDTTVQIPELLMEH